MTLPPLYASLLRWRNGGSFDSLWRNYLLLPSDQLAEARDIDAEQFDEPLWWHDQWIPFLDDRSTNYLCIDCAGCFGGQPGQIVEFWHEDGFRTIRHASFEAWLSTFVEGLELGLFDQEGSELDDGSSSVSSAAATPAIPGWPTLPGLRARRSRWQRWRRSSRTSSRRGWTS